MKLSEYMEALQAVKDSLGGEDLEVYVSMEFDSYFNTELAETPSVSDVEVVNKDWYWNGDRPPTPGTLYVKEKAVVLK